jgi:hypothetical protein
MEEVVAGINRVERMVWSLNFESQEVKRWHSNSHVGFDWKMVVVQ